jgi:hypothetical protein
MDELEPLMDGAITRTTLTDIERVVKKILSFLETDKLVDSMEVEVTNPTGRDIKIDIYTYYNDDRDKFEILWNPNGTVTITGVK